MYQITYFLSYSNSYCVLTLDTQVKRTKPIEIKKRPILSLATAEMSSTNGVNSPAIGRTSPVPINSATGDTSFHHLYNLPFATLVSPVRTTTVTQLFLSPTLSRATARSCRTANRRLSNTTILFQPSPQEIFLANYRPSF